MAGTTPAIIITDGPAITTTITTTSAAGAN